MQDLAKLSPFAEGEIEQLQADGIDLTPAEIVEINALGWAVTDPESRRLLARGVPVKIGHTYLWPLSLYAQEWFDRVGSELRASRQAYAMAYAMAHQYDEGEPFALDRKDADKAVRKWARTLRCTDGEINVAISQVLAQDEQHEDPPSPEDTGGMTPGDFSAFLSSALGCDELFWERRCAADYARATLDALVRQNSADGKPTASDPRIVATRQLGWLTDKIRILRGIKAPPQGYVVQDGEIVKDSDNG